MERERKGKRGTGKKRIEVGKKRRKKERGEREVERERKGRREELATTLYVRRGERKSIYDKLSLWSLCHTHNGQQLLIG